MSNIRKRWYHLDIFKFLGLSSLLLWHTIDWWYSDGRGMIWGLNSPMVEYQDFFQFGMSLFLFVCISLPIGAGISLRYMLNSYYDNNKNRIKNDCRKESVLFILKRSIILILMGTSINVISEGFGEYIQWDILQMVGLVSFFVTIFLYYFNINQLLLLGTLILLLAKRLSNFYFIHYVGYYEVSFLKLLNNILLGDPYGSSYYAFFPWASFVIFGFYIGNLIFQNKEYLLNKYLIRIGLILFPFYILCRDIWTYDVTNTWGPHIFMPKTGDILGAISIFSIFFYILNKIPMNKLESIMEINKKNIINIYSRNIMYIYVFHSIIMEQIVKFYVEEFRYNNWIAFSTFIWQYGIAYIIGFVVHKIRLKNKGINKSVDI